MADTPYTETEALLAALREDNRKVQRILSDMYEGEVRALKRGCEEVTRLCDLQLRVIADRKD